MYHIVAAVEHTITQKNTVAQMIKSVQWLLCGPRAIYYVARCQQYAILSKNVCYIVVFIQMPHNKFQNVLVKLYRFTPLPHCLWVSDCDWLLPNRLIKSSINIFNIYVAEWTKSRIAYSQIRHSTAYCCFVSLSIFRFNFVIWPYFNRMLLIMSFVAILFLVVFSI